MFFFKKKASNSITILPHPVICPAGEVVPAVVGKSIAKILLDKDVEISHSCQLQCACTTCHVYIMEGGEFVSKMGDEENRLLDNTSDRQRWSRLSCQAVFNGGGDLVVEIRE
jgi:2Fe-2S ferredoxin